MTSLVMNFEYNEKTRSFSYKSVVKSDLEIIHKVIAHILKLEYKFNYKYDRNKHITDIAGWILDVTEDIIKDDSCKKNQFPRAYKEYIILDKTDSTKRWISNYLGKRYPEFKSKIKNITDDEYDGAVATTFGLLGLSRQEIYKKMEEYYPEENK